MGPQVVEEHLRAGRNRDPERDSGRVAESRPTESHRYRDWAVPPLWKRRLAAPAFANSHGEPNWLRLQRV